MQKTIEDFLERNSSTLRLATIIITVAGLIFAWILIVIVNAWAKKRRQASGQWTTPTPVSRDWIAQPIRERQVIEPAVGTCPECGAALSSDCPEGLCPKCLLRFGLPESEVQPVEDRQDRTTPHRGLFTPPTPAELAPLFPQLEILELIGQGGMGAVYKARQTKLDRLVALKILPPQAGRDPAFAERFAREARALGCLSHPHIVAVHDFGEVNGLFYILMEYVNGVSLRQALADGPLKSRQALALVSEVCSALQYAHEEGVVHRDIKPENILLDRKGRVKIADFGLAKLLGRAPVGLTLTGSRQVMGTLNYLAPEQMERPQEVDHRADVYSLGVVFYEMLTGELPLGRFPPPSEKAGVDVRLDAIVLRALEKDPARRFQHASEVQSEVESVATGAKAALANRLSSAPEARVWVPAARQVRGPAVGLLVAAGLNWTVGLWALLVLVTNPPGAPEWGAPVFLAIFFGSGVIFFGALQMMRLESYWLAWTAAVLALLVGPAYPLGWPMGLWACAVLSRRDVKAAFAPAAGWERLIGRLVTSGTCWAALFCLAGLLAVISPSWVRVDLFSFSALSNRGSSGPEFAPGYETDLGLAVGGTFVGLLLALLLTGRLSGPTPVWRSGATVAAGLFCCVLAYIYLRHALLGRINGFDAETFARARTGPGWENTIRDVRAANGPYFSMAAAVGLVLVGVLQMRSAILNGVARPPQNDDHGGGGLLRPLLTWFFSHSTKQTFSEGKPTGDLAPLSAGASMEQAPRFTNAEESQKESTTDTSAEGNARGHWLLSPVTWAIVASLAIVYLAFAPWGLLHPGAKPQRVFHQRLEGAGSANIFLYVESAPFNGFATGHGLATAAAAGCLTYLLLLTSWWRGSAPWQVLFVFLGGLVVAGAAALYLLTRPLPDSREWPVYGATADGQRVDRIVDDGFLHQIEGPIRPTLKIVPQEGAVLNLVFGIALLILTLPMLYAIFRKKSLAARTFPAPTLSAMK
jgi:tRNA A-37 threonylcarbamoyl transferase component Bud32